MSDAPIVDVLVEDGAQEKVVTALVTRISQQEGIHCQIRVRWARGGAPRALGALRSYERTGEHGSDSADIVVVVLDGNCTTSAKRRGEIKDVAEPGVQERLVAGSPDPHVERWLLADPESFSSVVGYRPTVGKVKCHRDYYKQLLAESVRKGQSVDVLAGFELVDVLIGKMDLYRAGRNDHSLRDFVRDLRARLRTVR